MWNACVVILELDKWTILEYFVLEIFSQINVMLKVFIVFIKHSIQKSILVAYRDYRLDILIVGSCWQVEQFAEDNALAKQNRVAIMFIVCQSLPNSLLIAVCNCTNLLSPLTDYGRIFHSF